MWEGGGSWEEEAMQAELRGSQGAERDGLYKGLSEMARGLCVALHHLDTLHLRIIHMLPSSHSLNKEET